MGLLVQSTCAASVYLLYVGVGAHSVWSCCRLAMIKFASVPHSMRSIVIELKFPVLDMNTGCFCKLNVTVLRRRWCENCLYWRNELWRHVIQTCACIWRAALCAVSDTFICSIFNKAVCVIYVKQWLLCRQFHALTVSSLCGRSSHVKFCLSCWHSVRKKKRFREGHSTLLATTVRYSVPPPICVPQWFGLCYGQCVFTPLGRGGGQHCVVIVTRKVFDGTAPLVYSRTRL